jgi:hypothetical protein
MFRVQKREDDALDIGSIVGALLEYGICYKRAPKPSRF